MYAVLAYYLRHPNEVEEYLARREQKAEEVQQRIESQQGDLSEVRARLLNQSCNRVRGLNPRFLPLVILFLSVAVCGGCSSSSNKANSKPTPKLDDPKTHAARQEEDFQAYGSDIEGGLRTEARHAVLDFVKESLPGWNVKGMACQLREMSIFSIDADLEKQGKHAVITFDTRKFFPESGDPYWLAVPVNKFRLDRLHDLTDAGKAKELQEAEDTIDQLRTPPNPN